MKSTETFEKLNGSDLREEQKELRAEQMELKSKLSMNLVVVCVLLLAVGHGVEGVGGQAS